MNVASSDRPGKRANESKVRFDTLGDSGVVGLQIGRKRVDEPDWLISCQELVELWFAFDVGPDAAPSLRVERTLRWHGLRADARRYPGLAPLQDLEVMRRELTALMMGEPPDDLAP